MIDQKASKRNAGELAEEIDATGQESTTKAVKWVQEVEKRNETERQIQEAKDIEAVEHARRYTKNEYYLSLLRLAQQKVSEYDVPRWYKLEVVLKEDGSIIFGICKIGFRWFVKGMKPCGEPKYDMNCIERLAIQSMIALDELQLQHEDSKTGSGLVLTNTDKYKFTHQEKS